LGVNLRDPKLFLPSAEVGRLRKILKAAPGPTNLIDQVGYRTFKGPGGTKLHWASYPDASWQITLRDAYRLMGPVLLQIGLFCYVHAIADDRVLVWRQLRVAPPEAVLRISLFDTTSLEPIGRLPKSRSGDPVIHKAGLLAEVDLRGPWTGGLRTVQFPEPLRGVPEVLLLVHFIHGWSPELKRADLKRRRTTGICVAWPPRSEVEVLPLEWARSVEGHFHWIARIARDSATGKIVADGAGVRPFLLDESGAFLGWIRRADHKGLALFR
jgi:hypothetical protein